EPVRRDDLVRVEREPAALEAGLDVRGQPPEVRVDRGIVSVGVRESVLLVRAERELATGGAAECEPGPGGRRRALALEAELDQPRDDRVELERQDASDLG